MTKLNQMELQYWPTPFSDLYPSSFPSVEVITQTEACNEVYVQVTPGGFGGYPRYLLHFLQIAAYRCTEESVCPLYNLLSNAIIDRNPGRSSYIWLNSPWLKEFDETKGFGVYTELFHFLIFGGD